MNVWKALYLFKPGMKFENYILVVFLGDITESYVAY